VAVRSQVRWELVGFVQASADAKISKRSSTGAPMWRLHGLSQRHAILGAAPRPKAGRATLRTINVELHLMSTDYSA
jgi:hypothetical protein